MHRRWKALPGGLILIALVMTSWLAPARPVAQARPPQPASAAPQAAISFAPAASYPSAGNSIGIATGDFNRDGIVDLVNASPAQDGVNVLLGAAAGGFGPATPYQTGVDPFFVAVGDLNKDGREDLAAANYNGASVSVLIGDGSGGFGAATSFGLGATPTTLHIRDINADGNPDIILAIMAATNNVRVLLGDGAGAFAAPIPSTVGGGGFGSALADFNRDGRLDIALTNYYGPGYVVAFGSGAGAFVSPASYLLAGTPFGMVAGDFNRDGNLDLAAVLLTPANRVAVSFGSATGGFGAPAYYPLEVANLNMLAAVDLDVDGILDLAVANQSGSSISILQGRPDGSFGASVKIGSFSGPRAVVAGDFNRDGRPDLAVSSDGPQVYALLNTTPRSCLDGFTPRSVLFAGKLGGSVAADLNGDGHLDLAAADQESGRILFRYGDGAGDLGGGGSVALGTPPAELAAGDFNHDGRVDLVATLPGIAQAAVLTNDGAGGFSIGQSATYASPSGVTVLDANRDGKLDFATTTNTASMRIHFNNGAGGFGTIGYGQSGNFSDLASADFNRDGAPDVVLARYDASATDVRFNTGSGSYYGPATTAVGANPTAVAVGDWNRDGILDLATTNRTSDTVSILIGGGISSLPPFTATATLPAGDQPTDVLGQDIDNDGRLDLVVSYALTSSLSIYRGGGDGTFAARQPVGPAIANQRLSAGDFNEDGRVDLAVPDRFGSSVTLLLSNCPRSTRATVYLPRLAVERPILLATVNAQAIPTRPVTTSGQTYYTTSITLTGPLPSGGHFSFSSAPDRVQPIKVDDELVVTVNGQQRLVAFTTYPLVVEVPRAEIAQWLGQSIVVSFRDKFGSVVGSTPVWLIWAP